MTKEILVDVLRARILRGLHTGTLAPGDRLPSAREAGASFDADHRLVLAAYRELAVEKLVEIRERTGIYVARRFYAGSKTPGLEWLIDILQQGVARDVPIVRLHDWFRRIVLTRPMHAMLVEGTRDQIAGICYELREYYGIDARGLEAAALTDPSKAVLAELSAADLIVTTKPFASLVRALGDRVRVPVIIADVGLDPRGADWQQLLREPLYVVIGDERSRATLARRFEDLGCAMENLHMMVVGRDDLAAIPEEAAVYVTRGAAEALGDAIVPGRHVPPARGFAPATSRALIEHIVRANVKEGFTALGVPDVPSPRKPRSR